MDKFSIIKILHLEDDLADAQLVQLILKKSGLKFEYFFTDNEQDFQTALQQNHIDLVLSDYHLPDYSGSDALAYTQSNYPLLPFVFLSGAMGEDAAIESLVNGATDYVLKSKMERLVPAVQRAIKESHETQARIKAEKDNKKLLRAVQQNPNSIIITDINGTIEYANPKALKLSGYSLSELIGENPRIFSSHEKTKEEYTVMWDTLLSGNTWEGEFHNKKKNGELYWEQVSISPIIGNNGNISNFVATRVDISERKKLIADLIDAKEKAEEGDRLKTAFLHNISHEIRTPMNAIIGFSGFLLEPELLPDKRKYFAEIIGQSCNQLLLIISDIVSMASIEAGQEKITEQKVELNKTMLLLNEQFQLKAKNKGITLEFKPDSSNELPEFVSDEVKFTQILSNLLSNAVKFTKTGGVVFGFKVKNGVIDFFVKDTGIGIPSEYREVIFDRFRQVESSTTRQYGGSGLGLSISKAYTELLGGKIWFESEPGKGSAFYFSLPNTADKSFNVQSQQVIKEQNEELGMHKTILVAEDEDSNYFLIEEFLRPLNCKLVRANNGLEAFELCKSGVAIDLVLMDIKMPIMDGYEATKQITRLMPGIPVIVQTAYSQEEEKHKAMESGCVDFVSKPIKKELLIGKIREHIL